METCADSTKWRATIEHRTHWSRILKLFDDEDGDEIVKYDQIDDIHSSFLHIVITVLSRPFWSLVREVNSKKYSESMKNIQGNGIFFYWSSCENISDAIADKAISCHI